MNFKKMNLKILTNLLLEFVHKFAVEAKAAACALNAAPPPIALIIWSLN